MESKEGHGARNRDTIVADDHGDDWRLESLYVRFARKLYDENWSVDALTSGNVVEDVMIVGRGRGCHRCDLADVGLAAERWCGDSEAAEAKLIRQPT